MTARALVALERRAGQPHARSGPAPAVPRARARESGAADLTPAPLRFERVLLERRGLTLIAGLDLSLAPGETLSVMGPSGAGKTTLLRLIAGLTAATSGRVDRRATRLGLVFQEPRLLPWRTALENVALVADGPAREDRARSWLERLGLGDAGSLYPAALSGGMQQRVAIARALVGEPELVLVDEPFSGLDGALAEQLQRDLVTHLGLRPRIVVWVTHDPLEAASVSSRTLLLAGPPRGNWTVVDHRQTATLEPSPSALAGRLRRELDRLRCPEAEKGQAG